ncbi:MAG: hypothetical protein ABSH49_35335 [Bryobacteraceae bacterium]|jgi:hypothetical protein
MASHVDHFIQFYSQSPPSFGAADICSAGSDQSVERAAAFALVMSIAGAAAQKPVVKKIVVIMPPREAISSISHSSVFSGIVDAAQYRFRRELSNQELAAIRSRVVLIHTDNFAITSVLKALDTAGEHDAAVILCTASYRAAKPQPQSRSRTSPVLNEDQWVFHAVQLAQLATEYAKRVHCYVLVDTGEAAPQKDENKNALMSIVNCGYFTIAPERDPTGLIAAHSTEWLQRLDEGRVGSVFASIDALPEWIDENPGIRDLGT